MDDTTDDDAGGPAFKVPATRVKGGGPAPKERLAARLRENLRKRKDQARQRDAEEGEG